MQLLRYFKGVKIISYKKQILLTLSDQEIGQKAVVDRLLISLKYILVFARYYKDISVSTVL